MILSTTETIAGMEIVSYEGLVSGDAIVGAHVFKDFFAGMRDFFGGRSRAYEQTLTEARQEAIRDLTESAMAKGANAIVAIKFDCQVMGQKGSMIAVSATGTAVKLRK